MIDPSSVFNVRLVNDSRIKEVDFENIPFGKVYSDHMCVVKYQVGAWGDFKIKPFEDLAISPANATLHYAQSVFEGLKAYKNQQGETLVFRPQANAQRMMLSAERMCIPPITEEFFMETLTILLQIDGDWIPSEPGTSLYIRPIIFANDPYIGIRPSETYTFLIFTAPVGAYYSEPVNVKVETHYTRAVKGGVGFAKTAGNYAASLYPALKAQQEGYHQLIWTDGQTHEYIEEAGTMNLLFYIDDTLITAPTDDSILNGITKNSVLTLAKAWGIQVEERKLSVKELEEALKAHKVQEAFGAGTAATIAKVNKIGLNGTDYTLLQEKPLADRLFDTLEKIKTGMIEDTYGWMYKVAPRDIRVPGRY